MRFLTVRFRNSSGRSAAEAVTPDLRRVFAASRQPALGRRPNCRSEQERPPSRGSPQRRLAPTVLRSRCGVKPRGGLATGSTERDDALGLGRHVAAPVWDPSSAADLPALVAPESNRFTSSSSIRTVPLSPSTWTFAAAVGRSLPTSRDRHPGRAGASRGARDDLLDGRRLGALLLAHRPPGDHAGCSSDVGAGYIRPLHKPPADPPTATYARP